MVILYVAAGINHFVHPAIYIGIMPWWIPIHKELVIISGICEIVFGLLLMLPRARKIAAWCIIALLIAVFPANVQMMFNYLAQHNAALWIAIARLPVQIVLIWWAYSFTKR